MLEYESLKPLFEFLVMPKNNKKHWSGIGMTIVEFLHQVVMRATRVGVQTPHYIVLSYDEVSTVDNQSWLFVHYYVVQNWVRIFIIISLDRVLGSDNLTKVIMETFMIGGSLPRNQIAQKLICFGVDGVNVF
jgi:hypothetical protein